MFILLRSFYPNLPERPETMTTDKLTISLREAADIMGIGHSTAYAAVKNDTFPVPVIRIGGRYVVPKKPFMNLLGVTAEEAS